MELAELLLRPTARRVLVESWLRKRLYAPCLLAILCISKRLHRLRPDDWNLTHIG
jgi:hypothetical protein